MLLAHPRCCVVLCSCSAMWDFFWPGGGSAPQKAFAQTRPGELQAPTLASNDFEKSDAYEHGADDRDAYIEHGGYERDNQRDSANSWYRHQARMPYGRGDDSVTAITTRTGLSAGASAMLVAADWIKRTQDAAILARLLPSTGVGTTRQTMCHSRRTGVRVGAAGGSCSVGEVPKCEVSHCR